MKSSKLLSLFVSCLVFGCTSENPATPDDDDDVPVTQCPSSSGPGVVHEDDVVTDEVWRAADGPHRVNADVNVRNGATLTVEPCALVEVAESRYLLVPEAGTLVAAGRADAPIVFRGQGGRTWAGVRVSAPGVLRLAYATIGDAGVDLGAEVPALGVYGDGVMPADPLALFDHVTVRRSRGAGVHLERGATFLAGSRDLTVTESGSDTSYPVELEEHAMDALPTGAYTGNAIDEILLETYGTGEVGSGLAVEATLHDRGVPYHVGRDGLGTFVVGSGVEGDLAVLTIEAGVTLKMHPGTAFKIQHWPNDLPSTGALRAVGEPDRPIVFTSAAAAPAPGDWAGLWYGGIPSERNAIENARVEYAGGECLCSLVSCSAIETSEGAVIFTAPPASRFIRNTIVKDSAGHGFTQGFDGPSLDFTQSNFFTGVAGCLLTEPRNVDTSCPVNPLPACR